MKNLGDSCGTKAKHFEVCSFVSIFYRLKQYSNVPKQNVSRSLSNKIKKKKIASLY